MVVIRPLSNKLKQRWLVNGIHSDFWKLVALKKAHRGQGYIYFCSCVRIHFLKRTVG